MARIDIAKLRKSARMSQAQLAGRLQVPASFLSAIENGKSRLPDDKRLLLEDIFGVDKVKSYEIDERFEPFVEPHTHPDGGGDTLTHLLWHIHDQAHQMSGIPNSLPDASAGRLAELERRNDYLGRRNDELSSAIDELRKRCDSLGEENLHLKELLLLHGIDYRR